MKLFLTNIHHSVNLIFYNATKKAGFKRKISDILFQTINNIAEMNDSIFNKILKNESTERNRNMINIKNGSLSYLFVKKQLDNFSKIKHELFDEKDSQMKLMVDKEEKDLVEKLEIEEKNLMDSIFTFSNETPENSTDNVILEIIAGAGGEDAAMFANELLEMYKEYASYCRWKINVVSNNQTDHGGTKDASCIIEGMGVLNNLAYEKGVHRVQRVPFNSDRIHTSTASVVITPKADEVKADINYKDLRIETMRSSGPGGQNVNKRNTAVRVTHVPTGVSVHVMEERSAVINKSRAIEMIREKIYLDKYEKKNKKEQEERKKQMGFMERHEKIRTFNFVSSRVVDHRIDFGVNVNLSSSKKLLDPKILQSMIDKLRLESSKRMLNEFIAEVVNNN